MTKYIKNKYVRNPSYVRGQWEETCSKHGIDPYSNLTPLSSSHGTLTFAEIPDMTWLTDYFIKVETQEEQPAAGRKFDGDKARVDLLVDGCPKALMAISDVLTHGAKKYDDHNWKVVPNGPQRYKAAMMRHILAHASGESVDSETGISHLAHAACCVMFMLELELKKDA